MTRQPSIVEISDIASRYGNKEVSLRGLAGEYRVSRKTITGWLRDANVAVHARGYPPEATKEIIRRYQKDGASIRELVEAYGGSYGGIRNLLLDNKVQLRGRGQNDVRKLKHRAARSDHTSPTQQPEHRTPVTSRPEACRPHPGAGKISPAKSG